MQRHGQRAKLRFQQEGRRPRSKQSFLNDSWHVGGLSPFFLDFAENVFGAHAVLVGPFVYAGVSALISLVAGRITGYGMARKWSTGLALSEFVARLSARLRALSLGAFRARSSFAVFLRMRWPYNGVQQATAFLKEVQLCMKK
jgi:hypothetical protein